MFLDNVHTAELSSSRNSKQMLSVYKKYKAQTSEIVSSFCLLYY